jgi:hypothetical protein
MSLDDALRTAWERRAELSAAALDRAASFDISRTVERYEQLFESL